MKKQSSGRMERFTGEVESERTPEEEKKQSRKMVGVKEMYRKKKG